MWRNYLDVLEKQGNDWTDPTYLMLAYKISRKAAQQVIDKKLDDIEDAIAAEDAIREWEELNSD